MISVSTTTYTIGASPEGWEGNGPQPADDQTAAVIEQDLYRALEIQNERLKGVSVVLAISSLHAQRRADGRPLVFIPEAGP